MRVIVTGASGFIGHNVLLRAPRDWDIIAVAHRSPASTPSSSRTSCARAAVRCDLTDAGAVRALAASAAAASTRRCISRPTAIRRRRPSIRAGISSRTRGAGDLSRALPVGHLVYVSSGAVYDGLAGPVSPATAVRPRLPYAISKLASEQYVQILRRTPHAPASYINVRFFGAYGPYEPARKITTRWLRAVAARRPRVHDAGRRRKPDRLHVRRRCRRRFARACCSAAARSATVDFASGAPVSVNDIVAAMARALRRRDCRPPRRQDGGIHPVPDRRWRDGRAVRQSGPEFRSPTASRVSGISSRMRPM